MKKALCAAMALTLTMATAAPAFAADTNLADTNAIIQSDQISPRLVMNWSASGSASKIWTVNGNPYLFNFNVQLSGTVTDGYLTFNSLNKPTITGSTTAPFNMKVNGIINPTTTYSNGGKNVRIEGTLVFYLDGARNNHDITILGNGGSSNLTVTIQ